MQVHSPTKKTSPPAEGGKKSKSELKTATGPDQQKGSLAKPSAGTLLDYYKPKGYGSGNHCPDLLEGVEKEGTDRSMGENSNQTGSPAENPKSEDGKHESSKKEAPSSPQIAQDLAHGAEHSPTQEPTYLPSGDLTKAPLPSLPSGPAPPREIQQASTTVRLEDTMLTPSPDHTSRVRIIKGGQTGHTLLGPSASSSWLHQGLKEKQKGAEAQLNANCWVDHRTTLTELISQLEARHRVSHEGWEYSRRASEDPLWNGPWTQKVTFNSLLGGLANEERAVLAIFGTEPPGNVLLWEARKGGTCSRNTIGTT